MYVAFLGLLISVVNVCQPAIESVPSIRDGVQRAGQIALRHFGASDFTGRRR
jgi:hypothetical protein